MPIPTSVSHPLGYCSFIVTFEVGKCEFLTLFFFYKIVSIIEGLLHFHIKIWISLSISAKTGSWDFDRDCVESVHQFGEYRHLKNVKSHPVYFTSSLVSAELLLFERSQRAGFTELLKSEKSFAFSLETLGDQGSAPGRIIFCMITVIPGPQSGCSFSGLLSTPGLISRYSQPSLRNHHHINKPIIGWLLHVRSQMFLQVIQANNNPSCSLKGIKKGFYPKALPFLPSCP